MKKRRIYFLVTVMSIIFSYGKSQIPQVINASGNTSKSHGYTMEWSIGELALVNAMFSADGNYELTNGFIQPYSETNNFPYNQPEGSYSNVRIFPNPTHDELQISFYQAAGGKIRIELLDEAGHLIYSREMLLRGSGFVEKINMKSFTNGIYTLYIKRLNPGTGQFDAAPAGYKIIKL